MFYEFILDNQCYLSRYIDKQILQKLAEEINLFYLKDSKQEIFAYLWVNGWTEQEIMEFLKLWQFFEHYFG